MRTPFTTFPDEPTFEEIADEWPLGGKATDADTILERLIQFMWRGDFEERGHPTLFLAGPPDGCDMDADGTVTRRRPEIACDRPIDSDEQDGAELVAARVWHLYSRSMVLDEMQAFRFSIEGMTGNPDAMFMALAKLPLRDYDTDRGRFSATPRRLRIRLADLADWFDTSGLDWPRPAWLPPQKLNPDPTFVDDGARRPNFPDNKTNSMKEIAKLRAREEESRRRDSELGRLRQEAAERAAREEAERIERQKQEAAARAAEEARREAGESVCGEAKTELSGKFMIRQEAVFSWLDENCRSFNVMGQGASKTDKACLKGILGECINSVDLRQYSQYLATVKTTRMLWVKAGGSERRR